MANKEAVKEDTNKLICINNTDVSALSLIEKEELKERIQAEISRVKRGNA